MTGVATTGRAPAAPWTAALHLRAEVRRVVHALNAVLAAQRDRGRTALDDAVGGFVIQDGEAGGLLAAAAADWGDGPAPDGSSNGRPNGKTVGSGVARAAGPHLPLRRAERAFALTAREYDALVLALAVELDARVGRVVAYLNDHVGRPRPTAGLALSLGDGARPPDPLAALALRDRPAVRDGLLVLDDDGHLPVPAWAVRVAPAMLARLTGAPDADAADAPVVLAPDQRRLAALVLPDDVRARAAAWGEAVRARGRRPPPLLIVGGAGSGRRALAHAAVSLAGRPLAAADLRMPNALADVARAVRREARWHDAVPALHVRLTDDVDGRVDWAALWRAVQASGGPVVVTAAEAVVDAAAAACHDDALVIRLTPAEPAARVALWRALLPPARDALDDDALASIAARYRFAPGRIARVARRATAAAPVPRADDLSRAARELGAAEMGTLAERMPLPFTRADLVVPESVRAELDLAVAWLRHRHTVLDAWGFGRRLALGRGLAALFAGRPGTGKTMAAQVLARDVGCELFRVDLSRVMSKYIGETEKQLARLFDEAEAAGAMIFFDEADAIFGKRTEVKDAHDRYANVEIGYLLQRLEAFEGVAVLATNRMRDLDEAFVRRFHVIAHFPLPGPAERLAIWRGMLPAELAREPALDAALAPVAAAIELSGGEIRNAALAAAYLAAAEGSALGARHLRRAVRRELAKNGRVPSQREAALLEERGA